MPIWPRAYHNTGKGHNQTFVIQKHPGCIKRSSQELNKGQDEKELIQKSKWAAKSAVALVLMRIKF